MNVTFACPHCEQASRSELAPSTTSLTCSACGHVVDTPTDAFVENQLRRCVVCPSTDLFLRKDFPQWLGVLTVALGVLASSIAWAYHQIYLTYGILFATALLDVVLYFVVPNALMCYRCGAHYRGVPGLDEFAPFDLETHERYRQQAARLAQRRG